MVLPAASPMHTGNQWRLWVPKLLIGYIRSLLSCSLEKHPFVDVRFQPSILLHCAVLTQTQKFVCGLRCELWA